MMMHRLWQIASVAADWLSPLYGSLPSWHRLKAIVIPNDQNLRTLAHVHGTLAIFLLAALFFRRRLASPWPIALAVGANVLNETADLLSLNAIDQLWVVLDSASDLINGIFWPLVIFVLARSGALCLTLPNGRDPR